MADTPRVNATVGVILRWGTILTAVLLLVALVLAIARHGFPPLATPLPHVPFSALAPYGKRLAALDPEALATISGLTLLMLLPPARIACAAVVFARERDWRFLLFSLVALALVAGGNVLGIVLSN